MISISCGDFFLSYLFILLPLLGGFLHAKLTDKSTGILNGVMDYFLLISVGIQGVITGITQIFFPALVAQYVDWPLSPFVLELGMANLSYGILALFSFWMDESWKLAMGSGYSLFLFLTGIYHLFDISQIGLAPGNSGAFEASDLTLPIIWIVLLLLKQKKRMAEPNHSSEKSLKSTKERY